MEKERYIEIVNQAQKDRSLYKNDNNIQAEAERLMLKYNIKEEQETYRISYIIPDDNQFLVKYFEEKKDSNKISNIFNCSLNTVTGKLYLIKIHGPIDNNPILNDSLLSDQNAFLKRKNQVLEEKNKTLVNENTELLKLVSKLESEIMMLKREEGLKRWVNNYYLVIS